MIDLGDAAGDDVARLAYSAFAKARSSRKTVEEKNIERADPASCERDVPDQVLAAARLDDFAPGAEGNRRIDFATVPWDARASIIADPLDRAGIPYTVAFGDDGMATFELSRSGGMFLEALAARYVAAGVMAPDRFPNLDMSSSLKAFYTVGIDDRKCYDAVLEVLEHEGVAVHASWDRGDGRGVLVLKEDGFEKAVEIIEGGLSPAKDREPISQTGGAREAASKIPADRDAIIFQTQPRDRNAEIITNALKRLGVEEFSVATPDPQGQVVISVARSDAPALVQVAESYIDRGVIESSRFQGLEALKARRDSERRAASQYERERRFNQALARSRSISKGAAAPKPELSRAVTR